MLNASVPNPGFRAAEKVGQADNGIAVDNATGPSVLPPSPIGCWQKDRSTTFRMDCDSKQDNVQIVRREFLIFHQDSKTAHLRPSGATGNVVRACPRVSMSNAVRHCQPVVWRAFVVEWMGGLCHALLITVASGRRKGTSLIYNDKCPHFMGIQNGAWREE